MYWYCTKYRYMTCQVCGRLAILCAPQSNLYQFILMILNIKYYYRYSKIYLTNIAYYKYFTCTYCIEYWYYSNKFTHVIKALMQRAIFVVIMWCVRFVNLLDHLKNPLVCQLCHKVSIAQRLPSTVY